MFVDEEDPLKTRYNLDEYLSDNNNPIDLQQNINHQFSSDIEMLAMLSQDNGMSLCAPLCAYVMMTNE